MLSANEIIEKVNRLCTLKNEAQKIKDEVDELEGYFLKLSEQGLADTKLKSILFSGDGVNKVTATMASNLKVIYPSFLKKVFGDCYGDVVTEETTYKISAPAKRMLQGLYLKNYSKVTVLEVLKQISTDEKTLKVLLKKVKGINFQTDKKAIIDIAGISDQDAQHYAYFVSEAAVWESFTKLLKVNDNLTDEQIEETLSLIDGAVVAEETPKITVEAS